MWQFFKRIRNLSQHWRHQRAISNDSANADFTLANYIINTHSFKIKEKITVQTDKNGTKDVEIMVPLKYH